MIDKAGGAPSGALSNEQARAIQQNTKSPQVNEESEVSASPSPTAAPVPQYATNTLSGSALSVIVLAMLEFFRPTISSSSWTPWIRATLAITVLTLAVVTIVLVAKLA